MTETASTTTQKYIFSELLRKAEQSRIVPNKTKAARDWFRIRAQTMTSINRNSFMNNATVVNVPMPGRMYMFIYDAKHKDTLPFWDAFPLVFPIMRTPGGFTGLNLHYLPPILRARLMDALYTTTINKRYDDTTRLNLNYNTLRSASNLAYYKPCFKQYLYSHMRSKFIYIEPKEWDTALMLPAANWKKATAEQVYKHSFEQL